MKYLHYFENETAFNQERTNNYIEPWGSYTEGKGVDYNKSIYEKMKDEYLTFDILSDGVIAWRSYGLQRTISYSKNGSGWVNLTSQPQSVGIPTISVAAGDKVRLKGTASYYYDYEDDDYTNFGGNGTTCRFNLYGNIMSLEYGDNFRGQTTLKNTSSDCSDFQCLFSGCVGLIDASNLILPATTLSYHCYEAMFSGCTNLIRGPKLPATTLALLCYMSMFSSCNSLIEAPDLPSTTLYKWCYMGMFYGCKSLIKAPELPATTLVERCYEEMFIGCTNLNYIKAMFTTTPSSSYTLNWVKNVAASGTFIKNSEAQWNVTGDSGVPTGWTVQTATE